MRIRSGEPAKIRAAAQANTGDEERHRRLLLLRLLRLRKDRNDAK